jgi:hypothetical protein
MLITAQQVIDQALSLIGVKSTGSVITAEEYQDCLLTMNLMVDRWNLSDLLVYSTNPHTFAFVPNQQTYTLGTGGDFDMPRPSRIDRVSIQIPGSNNYNVELPIDADFDLESWQNLVVKQTPSQFPLCMWNNTGYPFMELNFWPIPQGPCSVVLYTWDLMPQIVNLVDQIELPTGYSDAIIYNLAVRLAQLFDRVPSPQLLAEAKAAKSDINDINAGTPTTHYDPMWSGSNSAASNIAAKSWGRVAL